jgi:hypothetical protein
LEAIPQAIAALSDGQGHFFMLDATQILLILYWEEGIYLL